VDDAAVEALAPGLEDLVRTCPVAARIVDESEQEGRPTLMLFAPDGSGAGIWVDLSLPFPEQVVHAADQLQDWAVEALWQAGLPAVWPACDLHPDTHLLRALVVDGVPHWVCPVVDTWEIRIGTLDPSA
jgi:hypothetical protein